MSCNNGLDFFPANFTIQNHLQEEEEEDHRLQSLLPSFTLPQDFNGFIGKRSPMTTNNVQGFCNLEMNGEEEYSDDGSKIGEKKRRLNMEQLNTLEKNFELGNKLESDRKLELARALGLQPRQIAIWFQNRRARSKTKQLEKDYDIFKRHPKHRSISLHLLEFNLKKHWCQRFDSIRPFIVDSFKKRGCQFESSYRGLHHWYQSRKVLDTVYSWIRRMTFEEYSSFYKFQR